MVGAGLTRGVSLEPWTPISIVVFGGNSGSVRPILKNLRTQRRPRRPRAFKITAPPGVFARRGGCWANEAEISVGTTVGMSASRFQQATEINDFMLRRLADHRSAYLESFIFQCSAIKLFLSGS